MRFNVLVMDYDGTIACDGRVDAAMPPAIREVRAKGIGIVLVTGRTLGSLGRVLPEQDLFRPGRARDLLRSLAHRIRYRHQLPPTGNPPE
jgi:hypothetical protein